MREETVLPFCRPNLTLRQKLEGSSAVCQPQGWLLLPGLAGVVEQELDFEVFAVHFLRLGDTFARTCPYPE